MERGSEEHATLGQKDSNHEKHYDTTITAIFTTDRDAVHIIQFPDLEPPCLEVSPRAAQREVPRESHSAEAVTVQTPIHHIQRYRRISSEQASVKIFISDAVSVGRDTACGGILRNSGV